MLIGAHQDDTGAADAGAAYLFSTNGLLLTTFTNPTPASADYFGLSLAAVGSDRVLIGAYQDDTGAPDAGAAYLFSTNGLLLTTFTNPTPASGDYFGFSLAAVGSDRVLIGAYQDDTGAVGAGAAYLFSTDGTLLITFTNPTPATGDYFGYSVAAVGSDRVLVGAGYDDTGATDAGAAYLFSLETYTPGLVADGVRSGSVTTASLQDGAVTAATIADGTITDADISPSGLSADKIIGGDLQALRLKVGSSQTLLGDWSTIAGGQINVVEAGATSSAIGGGMGNAILTNASYSAIGGGQWNVVQADAGYNAIGGGQFNSVASGSSVNAIAGGRGNQIQTNTHFSVIVGGDGNSISYSGGFNSIGGGNGNTISNGTWDTTIAGGQGNTAQAGARYSTVAGGVRNTAAGAAATVGGVGPTWLAAGPRSEEAPSTGRVGRPPWQAAATTMPTAPAQPLPAGLAIRLSARARPSPEAKVTPLRKVPAGPSLRVD